MRALWIIQGRNSYLSESDREECFLELSTGSTRIHEFVAACPLANLRSALGSPVLWHMPGPGAGSEVAFQLSKHNGISRFNFRSAFGPPCPGACWGHMLACKMASPLWKHNGSRGIISDPLSDPHRPGAFWPCVGLRKQHSGCENIADPAD